MAEGFPPFAVLRAVPEIILEGWMADIPLSEGWMCIQIFRVMGGQIFTSPRGEGPCSPRLCRDALYCKEDPRLNMHRSVSLLRQAYDIDISVLYICTHMAVANQGLCKQRGITHWCQQLVLRAGRGYLAFWLDLGVGVSNLPSVQMVEGF